MKKIKFVIYTDEKRLLWTKDQHDQYEKYSDTESAIRGIFNKIYTGLNNTLFTNFDITFSNEVKIISEGLGIYVLSPLSVEEQEAFKVSIKKDYIETKVRLIETYNKK